MIIKAGASATLRPAFAVNDVVSEPAGADFETLSIRAEITRLEQQLSIRNSEIKRLEQLRQAAYAEGEAAGREAGLAAAERREQDRLEMLGIGITQAVEDYRAALERTDQLALLVARECLDQMFGKSEDRVEQLCQLIRQQIARVDIQSVLSVHVSPGDFTDLTELLALSAQHGGPEIAIHCDKMLEGGEVKIAMALGVLSAGLGQQWGQLRATLSEMAAVGE